MGYYVGDIPAHPLVIEPALDITDFDTASATLTGPDATETLLAATLVDDMQVEVTWPGAPSILTERGAYELRITVADSGGALQRLPIVMVIVQDDSDGWHSLDSARDVWADAPESDRWLYELLEVAKADVLAYAPTLLIDAPAPANYRRAQQMHARDIWNASVVNPAGDLAEGTFALQPHPLDWMIKQVLRPKRVIGPVA